MNTANPATRPAPRPWRTTGYAIVLLGTGFALGATSLASAGAMAWHAGWHHHGPRVGMIQHVVHNALENVGATVTQEDKIHDIIATTYTDLDKSGADHQAMRKQILELMKAPTLDKAAIEKVRADKIAEMDAKSKKITAALIDAAGQLTPEQRTKLVQNAEEHFAQGGWGHGGWGGGHHRDRRDGPDGDHDRGHDGHGPDDGDHG